LFVPPVSAMGPATPATTPLSLHDALPSLDVEQVAGVVLGRGAPEVVEADVVEGGAGAEGGDVAAELAGLAVGRDDHGHGVPADQDRKSTRLNSSHVKISYAVFCLKKKKAR